jgi:hypothetical protein
VQACAFARLLLLRCSIMASLLPCRSACKRSLQQHHARHKKQWAKHCIHQQQRCTQMQSKDGTSCQARTWAHETWNTRQANSPC